MKSIGSLALLATLTLSAASAPASAPALAPALAHWAQGSQGSQGSHAGRSPELATQALSERDWLVKQADNICGLKSPNQLSKPAKVNYQDLLDATPEMKKMRDDKIDRNTPEGIRLRTGAVNRVNAACEKIRVANGYCSVWKEIKRKDGQAVADITAKVKAVL
jgi:hypothetical protein